MQLAGYFDRFRTRLAPGNARNVQALARVAGALAGLAQGGGRLHYASTTTTPTAKAYTVNDFLFASGLDNVNVFQLVRYARETKAVFKIAGFWQSVRRNQGAEAQGASTSTASDGPEPEGATGALHALLSFLQALTNDDADGRVIVDPEGAVIKFVLLNAAAQFAKVASSAHAVILASGTLSPLEPVLQLFPSTPKESIHNYACGHVVSKSRLLALAVGAGPSGATLDFRHASRSAHATMDELGRLLVNVCSAAPGGVVVFFPSFAYIEQVHARWSSTGALGTLSAKKTVFREPRAAAEVDSMLEEYGACIADGGAGAVLLCVVGGKLAEGINFGDALGRCVVMVGLPYPNPSDPELQERLKYIDRTAAAGQGGSAPPPSQPSQQGGNSASREHYINLCMKAVNQCVGRAIRHRRDYAAVLLVDIRYAAGASGNPGQLTGPLAKLPGWIQQSLEVPRGFGDAYGKLVRFYKGMQAEDSVQQ